jgi:hypothetical protein
MSDQTDEIIDILNHQNDEDGESYLDADLAEDYSEEEDDDDEEIQRRDRDYSSKIFDLISSIQSREFAGDEWENDDDTGYITLSLTEEEFFEFESVSNIDILYIRFEYILILT